MTQGLVLPENFISSEKLSKFSNIVFAENINKKFYAPSADLIVVDELEDELHKSITYKSSHLNLRSGSIIFSHADYIDELFFLLNKEKKLTNITLISSQSDRVISNKLFNKKPSSITKWFAVNNSIMNDFVENIPLGLGNSFSKKNVTSDEIPPLNKIFYKKNKISLYLNFNVNTNYRERSSLYQNFRNKNWCYVSTSNKREDYIRSLRSNAFILCPSGNGPDTHRMWESLYFGSIPIVKKHRCFEGYQGLPILYVDSFNEINKDTRWLKVRSKEQKTSVQNFVKKAKVKISTLDEYCYRNKIDKIDLLKIDTQGYEDKVLKGSLKTLEQKKVKAILTEIIFDNVYDKYFSFSDIEKFLLPNNFRMVGIYLYSNSLFDNLTFFADVIYLNKNYYDL